MTFCLFPGDKHFSHRGGGGQTFLTHRRGSGKTYFVGGGGGFDDVVEDIDVTHRLVGFLVGYAPLKKVKY